MVGSASSSVKMDTLRSDSIRYPSYSFVKYKYHLNNGEFVPLYGRIAAITSITKGLNAKGLNAPTYYFDVIKLKRSGIESINNNTATYFPYPFAEYQFEYDRNTPVVVSIRGEDIIEKAWFEFVHKFESTEIR